MAVANPTALGDRSVLTRHAADLLRTGGWLPTGWIDQTIPDRMGLNTGSGVLASGTLRLAGGIVIPGGRTVSNISMLSGTTGLNTGTHQWFCLVDQSFNVLAYTSDDTSTAWNSSTMKTLPLATNAAGGVQLSYTPANAIEVYVGAMVTATTPPTLVATTGAAVPNGITPIMGGSSTTGLTTTASLGATCAAPTATSTALFWAGIS